jgi:hypothetical protein
VYISDPGQTSEVATSIRTVTLVTRILVTSFLHKQQNIMHSRKIVRLHETQESMSKRVPKIKLQRIEEILPAVKEILVSVYHQSV